MRCRLGKECYSLQSCRPLTCTCHVICYELRQTTQYASETWTLTQRERKQLNIFERKVYRRILGPVYDNEKENWKILTNKEIYASVKKNYYNRDNKVK
jgi:hypothetical protein